VLFADRSRPTEAAFLSGVVEHVSAHARRGGTPQSPAIQVAAIDGQRRSGFELAFPAAVLWALMGCAATFAISTVAERTGGTLLRLRAAPISRVSIGGGKALACFVACVVDSALLVIAAHVLFDVAVGSLLALLAAIASASLCFAGITMTLGLLGRSEQAAAGAGWAALIVMAMLGGAMVPVSVMPEWLRGLSDLSPVKWGIVALEGAIWRDFSAIELLRPCATLVLVGAVTFALGLLLLRPEGTR
jgi:ABC-2 type transport system permease protein